MTEPDPEQLLKSLDASMAMMRAKHAKARTSRATTRAMSIVLIIIGVIGMMVVLQYMASELHSRQPVEKATPAIFPATDAK